MLILGEEVIEEIDEIFSADSHEDENSVRLQIMVKALYIIGSVSRVALANKDTLSKEDLLEAMEIVYDSACESAALLELTGEAVVH